MVHLHNVAQVHPVVFTQRTHFMEGTLDIFVNKKPHTYKGSSMSATKQKKTNKTKKTTTTNVQLSRHKPTFLIWFPWLHNTVPSVGEKSEGDRRAKTAQTRHHYSAVTTKSESYHFERGRGGQFMGQLTLFSWVLQAACFRQRGLLSEYWHWNLQDHLCIYEHNSVRPAYCIVWKTNSPFVFAWSESAIEGATVFSDSIVNTSRDRDLKEGRWPLTFGGVLVSVRRWGTPTCLSYHIRRGRDYAVGWIFLSQKFPFYPRNNVTYTGIEYSVWYC